MLQKYFNSKILIIILIAIIGAMSPYQLMAQDKIPTKGKLKRTTKKDNRKKGKNDRKTVDASDELRELHRNNQSKATRKRMKRNQKRAKRYNDHKREFFGYRWWNGTVVFVKKVFRKRE